MPEPLAVYVHLPWCVRKCPYGDFNSHARRAKVANLVSRKGLSVRETEALVRRMLTHKDDDTEREPPRKDPNVNRLEQDLTDQLGARGHLQHGAKGRGRLVISYNSLDELDGILAHIQ